jgi:hypothetical protein
MRWAPLLIFMLASFHLDAVIIDRIAIVAGNGIVKDSDIERDIRVTQFLNGQPLDLGLAARKAAIIRRLRCSRPTPNLRW